MLHDVCGRSEEIDRSHRFPYELVFAHDRKNLLRFNPLLIISRWKWVEAFEDPRTDSLNHVLMNNPSLHQKIAAACSKELSKLTVTDGKSTTDL